jgi:hypothetical protein
MRSGKSGQKLLKVLTFKKIERTSNDAPTISSSDKFRQIYSHEPS